MQLSFSCFFVGKATFITICLFVAIYVRGYKSLKHFLCPEPIDLSCSSVVKVHLGPSSKLALRLTCANIFYVKPLRWPTVRQVKSIIFTAVCSHRTDGGRAYRLRIPPAYSYLLNSVYTHTACRPVERINAGKTSKHANSYQDFCVIRQIYSNRRRKC